MVGLATIKPFITVDTTLFRSSGNTEKLKAEEDIVTGGSWLNLFRISKFKLTPKSISFFMCIFTSLAKNFQTQLITFLIVFYDLPWWPKLKGIKNTITWIQYLTCFWNKTHKRKCNISKISTSWLAPILVKLNFAFMKKPILLHELHRCVLRLWRCKVLKLRYFFQFSLNTSFCSPTITISIHSNWFYPLFKKYP